MASVERRSGKRGDVYVVRYRDPEGKSRSKTLARKADALAFASRTEVQVRDGDWIDPSRGRTTYGEFYERWTQARSVSPVRMSTERSQSNRHLLPKWGDVQLARIRPLDVQGWLADMERSGVGVPTIRACLMLFRQRLGDAVREGLIRANPAADTRAPRQTRKRVTTNDVLSADELNRLVAELPDQWKALVYLSGWLGWRWSEAMGLRVRDVDLAAGVLYLGEMVVVEVDGVLHAREGGKTDAATRTVPLPDPARDVLRWHMATILKRSDLDARVFVTEAGNTPIRSNFRRVFDPAVRRAGLGGRGINMRQLRHTAATLMLSSGLDVLDVQERLGHARGSITLDIYGRVLAGRREAGTATLGAAMAAANLDTTLTQPGFPHDPTATSENRHAV